MKKTEKQAITSTIYNTTLKTKSQLRAEGEKALQAFLKRGGAITEVKASRRKSTSKMRASSSRGFVSGTSGFANGYPKRTMGSI
jgi:hypothetical protein